MYQMSSFETGGVFASISAATRVVNWFQFELFQDANNSGKA